MLEKIANTFRVPDLRKRILFTLGLLAVILGGYRRWGWVRNRWFRTIHLLAIGIVIAESWLGLACPLTQWENWSREATGGNAYSSSFIQHWLHEILFYDFAPWVFTMSYTAFGILVLIAWLCINSALSMFLAVGQPSVRRAAAVGAACATMRGDPAALVGADPDDRRERRQPRRF